MKNHSNETSNTEKLLMEWELLKNNSNGTKNNEKTFKWDKKG